MLDFLNPSEFDVDPILWVSKPTSYKNIKNGESFLGFLRFSSETRD